MHAKTKKHGSSKRLFGNEKNQNALKRDFDIRWLNADLFPTSQACDHKKRDISLLYARFTKGTRNLTMMGRYHYVL